MDELAPVLGAQVEPPADVWANAVAGALEDPRSAEELEGLVPDNSEPDLVPPNHSPLEDGDSRAAEDDSAWESDWSPVESADGEPTLSPEPSPEQPPDDPGNGS